MKKFRVLYVIALLAIFMLIRCDDKPIQKIPQSVEKDLFQANQDFVDRKFDNALENAEKIIKVHSGYLPAQVLKGKILFYTKRYKESEQVFQGILKREAGHQGALLWLARILMTNKKTEAQAEAYLLHGLNNNPEDFTMHFELARFYAKTGNLRQAMVEYQKTLLTELDLSTAYRSYESLLIQHKLTDRAEKIKARRIALEVARDK